MKKAFLSFLVAAALLPAGAQAADAPAVTQESLTASLKQLQAMVDQAKAAKVETIYAEALLYASKPLANAKKIQEGYIPWLAKRTQFEMDMLKAAIGGKADPRVVPPIPDWSKLEWKGNYLTLNGKPVLPLTTGEKADPRFVAQGAIYHNISAVGAFRWDYKTTPIWELYQKDPKSHRVFDGGWCGHIISDKWSAGNTGECIISLEYPPMLEVVKQCVLKNAKEFASSPRPRTKIMAMDWEFTYQNYDEPSKVLWQGWLKDRYKTVDALNKIWKTSHKNFNDIDLPPIEADQEKNPAKYYDHGEFNLWRFTQYLKKAKGWIASEVKGLPIMVGGGMPFGAEFWKDAIDEEGLMTEKVVDVWLSETGSRSWGTASFMDLQNSMNPNMAIIDPEYHSSGGYMSLMFLHGCGNLDFWDWAAASGSLDDSYSLNHGALDLRRLAECVTQFPKALPQAAILYSRASLIQRHPGGKPGARAEYGVQTPYSLELEKCYRNGTILDTQMGFLTSRQAKEGIRKDLKVLIITGAYFENQDVVKSILAFARNGGTVLITPTSLVADEYTRRRDYLKDIGVEIIQETLPKFLSKKATPGMQQPGSEYDFIQGPIAKTIVEDNPTAKIAFKVKDAGFQSLSGEGIRQAIKLTGPHDVLATYEDNNPAIVRTKLGSGQVIYLAMQLAEPSMSDLLDWVYNQAGVDRPIRTVGADGKRLPGIESRTVAFENGYLTYVYNLTNKVVQVKLQPKAKIGAIQNLTTCQPMKADETLECGPYEWFILKTAK